MKIQLHFFNDIRLFRISLIMILLMVILMNGCSITHKHNIRFDDFNNYEDSFLVLSERLITDFRTSSNDERFLIELNNDSPQLIAENGNEIVLLKPENEALKSITSLQMFDYIIVGNTYVSYTKFGTAYSIVYSEDDVRPKGSWKYTKDVNVSIDKIKNCWYEIKANGD